MEDNTKKFINRKKRNRFGLPIIISLDDGSVKLPARLNDISDEGLSFKSNIKFSEGDTFDILIPFPKGILFFDQIDIKPLIINVQVRWFKDYQDQSDFLVRHVVGAKILNSSDDDFENKINKLIKLSEQIGQKPLGY